LRSWDGNRLAGNSLPHTPPFIRHKEKGAIFNDRTAESSAELILIFLRLDGVEVPLSVQNSIAEILIKIPVPLVGTRLRDDVDHRPGVAAVLCVESVADHAKFIDRVGRGLDGWEVHELVVGVTPVHTEIVCATTAAIDGDRSGIVAAIESATTGAELRLNSGLQLQELVGIASVER